MTKIFRMLRRRPILNPLMMTLAAAALNLLIYYFYEETGFAGLNLIISVMLFGTILFPLYYALTFAFFFACVNYSASDAKPFIIAALILYLVFTLPFINMNLLAFGF